MIEYGKPCRDIGVIQGLCIDDHVVMNILDRAEALGAACDGRGGGIPRSQVDEYRCFTTFLS